MQSPAGVPGVLRLENTQAAPVSIRRVAYRVPLRYRQGVFCRPGAEVTAGKPFSDRVELQEDREDSRYQAGDYLFAAQVDFVLEGEPGRIYFTTREPGSLDDASYPRQGFAVLGPIPRAEIDLETRNPEELLKKEWTGPDEKRLEFAPVDAATAGPLSTEVIPVRGRWDNHGLAPCIYLLRSRVHSPDARRAGLFRNVGTVPAVWLNGDPAGDTCSLRAGDNELLLAYEPPVNQRFSPEHAGPMFRIVDARSGRRLEGIRYQP